MPHHLLATEESHTLHHSTYTTLDLSTVAIMKTGIKTQSLSVKTGLPMGILSCGRCKPDPLCQKDLWTQDFAATCSELVSHLLEHCDSTHTLIMAESAIAYYPTPTMLAFLCDDEINRHKSLLKARVKPTMNTRSTLMVAKKRFQRIEKEVHSLIISVNGMLSHALSDWNLNIAGLLASTLKKRLI